MPHLNSILYLVMPLPLNMFDDYQDSNMIIALDAFQHIIDNTVSNCSLLELYCDLSNFKVIEYF